MKLLSIFLVLTGCFFYVHASTTGVTFLQKEINSQGCEQLNTLSGVINYSSYSSRCWIINVPENSYLRMNITNLHFQYNTYCSKAHLNITISGTNEEYKICSSSENKAIVSLSDVYVKVHNQGYSSSFKLQYHTESVICGKSNHFRCSNHTCIHDYQVCDGKVDCEDGSDERGCETGVAAVKGVNTSLERALSWVKRRRDPSFGWGKDTPRAITALYLSGNVSFRGNGMEQELMAKELELQMSVALLRNSTEHISVNELSMFINALTVTCYDPRRFFGNDLLQTLSDRLSLTSPIPGPYLTLCSSNWTLHENVTESLLNLLKKESSYPFDSDLQAITLMVLTCLKNHSPHFTKIENATMLYNATIQKFIDSQNSDGSFGNPQTTAWITQALMASGQESNKKWKLNATINYLMHELNSSEDFLLTYLSISIFKGKSLLDFGKVNCSGVYRKHRDEIDDLTHKLNGNGQVQYSLFIGNNKNVIHTMYLRIPEDSTAYDVMKVAQLTDPKYKFLSKPVSGYQYIYEVAGISNDPEAGMFWLIYMKPVGSNETFHVSKSPDRITVKNEDHLILWYKSSHI